MEDKTMNSPDSSKSLLAPAERSYDTALLVGAVVLFALLVYAVLPILSPFVVVGAILFLLFPLRHSSRIRSLMWLSVTFFVLWFIYSLGTVLLPFIIAFLLAYLMNPFVTRIEALRVPRWLGALFVMIVLLGSLVIGLVLVTPVAIVQFSGILERASVIVSDLVDIVKQGKLFEGLERYGLPVDRLREILTAQVTPKLEDILRTLLGGAFGVFSSLTQIVTGIINAIVIPFLVFYLLKDYPAIIQRARRLVPAQRRESVVRHAGKIDALFGRYLRGALTVALIHGILTSFLLGIFGISYPLVLGLIAGFLSLIPYFGLFTSLALSLIVALFSGEPVVMKIIFVLLTFGFLQILEFSVLSPAILGKQIGLHPVLLIFSLIVFGYFLGFVGLLIAVPSMALLVMMLKEWESQQLEVSEIQPDA